MPRILESCSTLATSDPTTPALDDKTPAEVCGIEIKGNNKWITLIQNASKS